MSLDSHSIFVPVAFVQVGTNCFLFNIKSSSLGPGSTVVEKGKTRGQIKTKNKQGGKTP